jgi:hypothetical protein
LLTGYPKKPTTVNVFRWKPCQGVLVNGPSVAGTVGR